MGPKKMRDQVFWGWNLKIILSYLKSAPWYLSGYKISWKMKMPKLGAKNALFGYFPTGVWKTYCHTWNQRPWICLVAKFGRKLNILKFGTKNALFGYFWVRILKNLLSYLKLAPSNWSNSKISWNNENG